MKINCKNVKCLYNNNGVCHRETIKIEGSFANSSLGTFCCSFNKDILIDSELKVNEDVRCNATNCKFQKNGKCTKDVLEITGWGDYRSETECGSFENKFKENE